MRAQLSFVTSKILFCPFQAVKEEHGVATTKNTIEQPHILLNKKRTCNAVHNTQFFHLVSWLCLHSMRARSFKSFSPLSCEPLSPFINNVGCSVEDSLILHLSAKLQREI